MDAHLELETLGILRQTKVPQELGWLTDAEKRCLLMVLASGEGGLHKSQLKKILDSATVLARLEFKDFLKWETNRNGTPSSITLTWRGEEIAQLLLQIAKNESQRPGSTQRS